jgi:hypothetical protein
MWYRLADFASPLLESGGLGLPASGPEQESVALESLGEPRVLQTEAGLDDRHRALEVGLGVIVSAKWRFLMPASRSP